MTDWTRVPAHAIAGAVRRGEVTAVAVVEAHLGRVAEVNPILHAVVDLAADEALAAAGAADRALQDGRRVGPLHGVPFTVKDWIEVAGRRCTAGMLEYIDHKPVRDATVVRRMRDAGAIFLGKTNPMTGNPVFGITENPYRLGHSPAGSSSGEAAIIAACGSPLGLGSDSGGSIRQPAHVCGIAGLKPTAGRVPLTGHLPFICALSDPRTTIGPLARTVADLALALPVISGPDWRDASVVPMPLFDPSDVRIPGLRVACYTTHPGGAHPDADMVRAVEVAAAALDSAGAEVRWVVPPRVEETYELTRAYWRRPESESGLEWVAPANVYASDLGPLSAEDSARLLFEWDRFRRAFIAFMADFDVILTPAANRAAVPHGEPDGGIPFTLTYSLTGYPAVVVRAGATPDGLPCGVQLVGRPWREDVALAAARIVEDATGGWVPPDL